MIPCSISARTANSNFGIQQHLIQWILSPRNGIENSWRWNYRLHQQRFQRVWWRHRHFEVSCTVFKDNYWSYTSVFCFYWMSFVCSALHELSMSWFIIIDKSISFFQHRRTLSGRNERIICVANVSPAPHLKAGSVHARPASTVGCHAAHNGQCCNILCAFSPFHFHLQVRLRSAVVHFCKDQRVNGFICLIVFFWFYFLLNA